MGAHGYNQMFRTEINAIAALKALHEKEHSASR